MPKKPNFLGGMQNYNPNNGEYEPALVGADGKVPQSFKSFKKGDEKNDAFDDINDKRMGKKKSKKEDQPKEETKSEPKEEKVEEEKVEVNEDEISEALADYQYQVTGKTTAGEYAEEVAKKLGTSKEKVFNVIKAQAPEEIKETSNMSNIIGAYETGDDFKDEEKAEKPTEEPKPKSLNDFTDELFEKVGVKTFNSKKYKNKEGEIVEIRRFGEGQNAIRYNETKDIVEQVWYNGEKIY